VRFTPAGAAAFVAAPLHELTDSVAAAGALWGGRGEGLPARLADASDGDARLGVLTRHLLACQRHEATDLAVDRAVRLVQRARGGVRVRDLAAACNLSPRQLERRFRDRVGLSPKRYARVVRFRRLVARARAMPRPDWAGLAVDCGFADQPHLVREFAAFAGLPPAAHASERNVLDGLFGADVAFVQDTPP
jgi:AraC-like DNA-binding protein